MTYTARELRDAFHYLFVDEIPALEELVRSLPSNPVIINIGCGAGTSGLLFFECRPDTILHTVDITDASSPLGCLIAERQVFKKAGYTRYFNKRWFQHHVRSQDLAVRWKVPVNMVFIDGDHSYEGCRDDILGWIPHIVPGGIIAVHDYAKANIPPTKKGPHPISWPTVDKAVIEFLVGKYEQILLVDSLVAFRMPEI